MTSASLVRNFLRNVQPGARRAMLDQIKCLVNRIVGTDEEIGAGLGQFVGRRSINSATPGQSLA